MRSARRMAAPTIFPMRSGTCWCSSSNRTAAAVAATLRWARPSGSIHRQDVDVDVGGAGRTVRGGQRKIDRAEIEVRAVEVAGECHMIVQRVDRGRAERTVALARGDQLDTAL